jgi:hypothetical protein
MGGRGGGGFGAEAEFLNVIGTKIFRVFSFLFTVTCTNGLKQK